MDPTQAKELLAAMEAAGIPIPTQLSGSTVAKADDTFALDDNTDIDPTLALHCNTAGDVKVDFANGGTKTLAVLAGYTYPWSVTRVYATGTTATVEPLWNS